MTIINMYEAKTNLSKIAKLLEDGKEDYVIVARNGEPLLRITLEKRDVSKRLGAGKGLFEIPESFDELELSDMFEGEIFPCK